MLDPWIIEEIKRREREERQKREERPRVEIPADEIPDQEEPKDRGYSEPENETDKSDRNDRKPESEVVIISDRGGQPGVIDGVCSFGKRR